MNEKRKNRANSKRTKARAKSVVAATGATITDQGTESELHHPPGFRAVRALDGSVQHVYLKDAAR